MAPSEARDMQVSDERVLVLRTLQILVGLSRAAHYLIVVTLLNVQPLERLRSLGMSACTRNIVSQRRRDEVVPWNADLRLLLRSP